MDNYKCEIGKRLKTIRKKQGLTQEKLSEMLGISQKHYSEVERGITGLSVRHLIQLSDILNISLDYLLKGSLPIDTENLELKNTHIQINQLLYSSSEYTRNQMINILNIISNIAEYEKSDHSS